MINIALVLRMVEMILEDILIHCEPEIEKALVNEIELLSKKLMVWLEKNKAP